MKPEIYEDELYPFFGLANADKRARVMSDFNELQIDLEAIHKANSVPVQITGFKFVPHSTPYVYPTGYQSDTIV